MDKVLIKKLNEKKHIPYDLLFLADPSREAVEDYRRNTMYRYGPLKYRTIANVFKGSAADDNY